MSTFNTVVGVFAALAAGQAVLSVVLPGVPPIEVHSLSYKDGEVEQVRTVRTVGDTFPAEWRAAVVFADTGKVVTECHGSGFWPYKAGYYEVKIDLAKWVGSDACTGEYLSTIDRPLRLVASWHWGDDFTKYESNPFSTQALFDVPD